MGQRQETVKLESAGQRHGSSCCIPALKSLAKATKPPQP